MPIRYKMIFFLIIFYFSVNLIFPDDGEIIGLKLNKILSLSLIEGSASLRRSSYFWINRDKIILQVWDNPDPWNTQEHDVLSYILFDIENSNYNLLYSQSNIVNSFAFPPLDTHLNSFYFWTKVKDLTNKNVSHGNIINVNNLELKEISYSIPKEFENGIVEVAPDILQNSDIPFFSYSNEQSRPDWCYFKNNIVFYGDIDRDSKDSRIQYSNIYMMDEKGEINFKIKKIYGDSGHGRVLFTDYRLQSNTSQDKLLIHGYLKKGETLIRTEIEKIMTKNKNNFNLNDNYYPLIFIFEPIYEGETLIGNETFDFVIIPSGSSLYNSPDNKLEIYTLSAREFNFIEEVEFNFDYKDEEISNTENKDSDPVADPLIVATNEVDNEISNEPVVEDQKGFSVLWIAILSAVLLGVTVLVFVLVRKKKRG